ncbi:MAG TPA: FN3 associated domain-containing protein [Candidatus Paceibacterota bacterium]
MNYFISIDSIGRNFALATILFATCFSALALMPQSASAATRTLTNATSTSNNASTTLAKVGDIVSFQLDLDGGVSATNTPVINIRSMGTTTMTGSAGAAAWTYSTTTTSGWSNGTTTFTMEWMGSLGEATSTFASVASTTLVHVRFDKTAPTVSTITSNATAAGALKVGDTIAFTLTPGATEYAATVAGSYNGQALTWSTADSGATFTATYTIAEGHTDRTSALQISGVIVTDAAGNASSAGAGTDIVKTIDANSPAVPTADPVSGSDFSGSETITLISPESGGTIRYTTDDSNPTCSTGTLYSSGFAITETETVKAIFCDAALNGSSVASFAYTRASSGGGGGGGKKQTDIPATTPALAPTTPVAGGTVLDNLRAQLNALLAQLAALTGQSTPNANAYIHANANASFMRSLSVGLTGDDVKALQQYLNAHGHTVAASGPGSPGNETSFFGPATKAALIKLQEAAGIDPIGIFGPKTQAYVAANP